jgi:hypothetical protein
LRAKNSGIAQLSFGCPCGISDYMSTETYAEQDLAEGFSGKSTTDSRDEINERGRASEFMPEGFKRRARPILEGSLRCES